MNKTIVIVIILLAGVAGYFLLGRSSSSDLADTPTPSDTVTTSPMVSTTETPSTSTSVSVKTFTVVGTNFSFTPSEIKVNKGDTVKIVFQNSGGTHDWVIDEFNAKTSRINGGQSETVQFIADKVGTFEYYCSVGEHRAMGMRGNLIVQ